MGGRRAPPQSKKTRSLRVSQDSLNRRLLASRSLSGCLTEKGSTQILKRAGNNQVGFYQELIRTVFQAVDAQGKLRNRVVAFTSATRGEGVSYVVNVMARELAGQTQKRVLRVDAAAFAGLCLADPNHITNHCDQTEIDNLLTLSVTESARHVMAGRGLGAVSDWDAG